MKVIHISDTHGQHNKLSGILPDGDVICHTGDYSSYGTVHDFKAFIDWFSGLEQYSARIFISGNHDLFAFDSPDVMKSMVPENVIYLEDSEVIIDGIKFYGTPWQPIFLDWAYNLSEEELAVKYAMIPGNTDVLLTHCPPKNILDLAPKHGNWPAANVGSTSLLERVKIVNPITHAFGHIHEGYGELSLYDNIGFINASVLNGRYQMMNYPVINYVVKIPK